MPEGELSQEDIDRLLGGSGGEDASSAGEAPAPTEEAQAGAGPPGEAVVAEVRPSPVSERSAEAFELLRDVPLNVKIELGRSRMYIEDILKLGKGSVVEMDKLAGDPMDILVNDRLVARGELIVLDDYFCVRVTEIVSPEKRREQEA